MKLLINPQCKQEILARLAKIHPDSQRRWGRMNVSQMICHLNDSFLGVMGDRAMEIPTEFSLWPALKWVSLYSPMPWPKGVATRPEFDQVRGGGTPPSQFDVNVRELLDSMEKFTQRPRTFEFRPHPMFKVMTEAQWMRWGYLHMDHHLRQFGE
jgi:hypothetical protein